ncbi:ATP-binding protein [Pseudomonadota bacterium]|nr:ATP-binding protein [Pseudomonadota bacterium]
MIKRLNSLQTSLLLHELSFILLVLITASVGIAWSSSWQKNSEEALRIGAMNTAMQNIRGDVYRQLKEVFDASFLQDSDAIEEYQEYTKSIHIYLQELQQLADDKQELQTIESIYNSYDDFYQQTILIFDKRVLNREQKKNLDTPFERQILVNIEQSIINLSALISDKQTLLIQSKARWRSKLIWIASIPVIISIYLLIIARRYINKNVVIPLTEVINGAKLISKGELGYSVAETGVVELVRLAETINTMAAELIINRDNLVDSNKQAALGQLIPLVAHNIRNPLAGIRAAAQVACDDQVSEITRDTLTDIIIAVDRLERWVTSLLSYLHPVKPHLTQATLTDITDNALSLIELQLLDKNITIVRKGWSLATAELAVDVNLFEQVIFNLVQNAVEASPPTATITLTYKEKADCVSLSIDDEGRGMKFDPVSEQVIDGESKRLSCGLGIPFAIKVIKQHGGELRYQSTNSIGTSVIINLKV